MSGRIVLLNGTSSSGKSSIAADLLELLPTPWFCLSVDVINGLRGKTRTRELAPTDLTDILRRTRAGFHRVVAGMAEADNDVVVDYVLSEEWRWRDCRRLWRPYDVLLVGVHCTLPELQRRERQRGDREVGQAAGQLATVHSFTGYDLELDTEQGDARACAERIAALVADPPSPTVFQRTAQLPERPVSTET